MDGSWRETSAETLGAILGAMGAGAGGPPPPDELALVVEEGSRAAVPEPELVTEDGARLRLHGELPGELPLGYHRLLGDRGERRLVVAPPACHLPDDLEGWGLAVQLYSLTSRQSLGMGDLADLAELGGWASGLGAAFLMLSPLHAAVPGLPQEPSPYYPSSRRFMNPLYLRLEDVPAGLAQSARAGDLIDRDAVYRAKLAALEAEWERVSGRVAGPLADFRRRRPGLEEYATFCALSETHGRPWRAWPAELRHPGSAAVARFAQEQSARVRFHEWLQWQLEEQLRDAAGAAGTIHDIAVGVHPDGADAWAFQDQIAHGVSIGAPPDTFNTSGQDWGLPPFDPWRLAAAGYEPFIQTVRAAMRHAAGVRMDHVMGLFRLYWIPAGGGPAAGTYVGYPSRELLAIVALESARAGAYVVGEDLGTVEDRVRRDLYVKRVLSYRLLWFEPGPPDAYPRQALAALATHDLPTLLGVWSGADPMPEVRERLAGLAQVPAAADPDQLIEAAYRLLARAPSRLLALTLEDLAGQRERPNRPGTTDPANWSRRLPLGLEELRQLPRAAALSTTLSRHGRD